MADAAYNFDISFKWNTPPDDLGRFLLDIGRVSFPGGIPTPAGRGGITPYEFEEGDTIVFNGFNATSGATAAGYSVLWGTVIFKKSSSAPATQTTDSPVSQTMQASTGLANGTGTSVVLDIGSNVPLWAPLTGQQALSPGSYQFTVIILVLGPNNVPKVFMHDPEMIVQATPPGPDEGLGLAAR